MNVSNTPFQVELPKPMVKRIGEQADKLGMTKREFMVRMINEALPRWEKAAAPGPKQ